MPPHDQQFPVSRMVYPAYTPDDAPHVGLKTPRRLCLVQQLNSATGDMGMLAVYSLWPPMASLPYA
jgi:hypothetical protein